MPAPAVGVRQIDQPVHSDAPLVTVAVPTYQRVGMLGRALDSVLGQDYPSIELIISDDASTDGTADLCAGYAARCSNVRYLRQPSNIGPTANFGLLRTMGSGKYFLFVCDDDWIDPGYVSACVAALEANPAWALVAGRTWYHRGAEANIEPESINVGNADGPARVLDFYRAVGAAGILYGIVPTVMNNRLPKIRNVMGNDLLHLAGLAYLGPLHTLENVSVHRTADGTSVSLANVAATLGLGRFQAYAPQLALAYWVMQDIAWKSPLYTGLGGVGRLRLGLHAGWIVFWRFVPNAIVKFGRLMLVRPRRGRRVLRTGLLDVATVDDARVGTRPHLEV